jgi:hypothetical protein
MFKVWWIGMPIVCDAVADPHPVVHAFKHEVVRLRNRERKCAVVCAAVKEHSESQQWDIWRERTRTWQATLAEQEAWCKEQGLVVCCSSSRTMQFSVRTSSGHLM